jgi:hypothetical protein
MANNKVLERNSPLTIGVPVAGKVTSGMPLLFGTMAVVANESDPQGSTDPTRVTTGNVSVDTEGAFNLTVTAKSALSPAVNSAVNVGDLIYYDGGTTGTAQSTKDTNTAVTYGGTLDKNTGGTLFGIAVTTGGSGTTGGQLLASGTTGVIAVLLKGQIN